MTPACIVATDGWCTTARRVPSPNHDARPQGTAIDMAVLHNISLPPGEFGGDDIERLFTNTLDCASHPFYAGLANLRVAAHFLIRRDGELVQFVSCNERAWHAGVSRWLGRERCNDFSIGIEIEGSDYVPFNEAQYATLAALLPALRQAYPIRHLVGHNDIAPLRKTDPGPFFDWQRVRLF
ncbi:AmpD protein [Formivibrio citricus]|uniref:1,6-anhydro-N-acetylmuramyl-L-alanine amidase AmpD n=1 Tax=Formivibrio citricus TaxID=83765 RepID=A0A1I5DHV9_9NEIS|nr:1,6-anhydro-N-acetylmuramyl-L-alanine amidase AmpD [Formivibrio citricus]SFN98793.1 AmpD protein [Formivibrio citricus]